LKSGIEEGLVKKYLFLALLFGFAAISAQAQTTVANFDNPACSGNGVALYQGIDFSLSPWDCENPNLAGQTGTSISWYQKILSGQFRFQSPQVLVSLSAATSSGSGTLTIATDAGETFSHSINSAFQTLTTGFSKPASAVTVQYPGGWTIQLDNITYRSGTTTIQSGILNASASLTWDDGTPVAGSLVLTQLTGTTTQSSTFTIDSTATASGTIKIDLSQTDPLTFQVALIGLNGTSIGPPATFQVIKAMFPATATGISAKIVLWKATTMIKSFDIALVP
jgi:hypothetical protein